MADYTKFRTFIGSVPDVDDIMNKWIKEHAKIITRKSWQQSSTIRRDDEVLVAITLEYYDVRE